MPSAPVSQAVRLRVAATAVEQFPSRAAPLSRAHKADFLRNPPVAATSCAIGRYDGLRKKSQDTRAVPRLLPSGGVGHGRQDQLTDGAGVEGDLPAEPVGIGEVAGVATPLALDRVGHLARTRRTGIGED